MWPPPPLCEVGLYEMHITSLYDNMPRRIAVVPQLHGTAAKALPAAQPEDQEGVYVNDLAPGTVLEIETQHHHYTLVKRDGSMVRLSGHPRFCPEPIGVLIEGSVGNNPILYAKLGYIGRGMYMVFKHPIYDSVTTSRLRESHMLG